MNELEKFVDQLPIPPTLEPTRKTAKGTYYDVSMREFRGKLHRDLPPTTLWGYEGQFPGPTIEVSKDEPVNVTWHNALPGKHILPVDTSIHGLDQLPEVRTVVHLHGIETKPDSDGHPEAWYTSGFQETGPVFTRKTYHYPNHQRASILWYHDHAMGLTRLNVYAGLAGMYLIRDKQEARLNLPSGEYEIPLFITDRTFHENGALSYPEQPEDASPDLPNPSIVPAFLGDTILVNGKVWPYLEVEPRKYRFRIINGSNTRSYRLALDNDGMLHQIGSDGGLLRKRVDKKEISLQPAERIDVIIDFSKFNGEFLTLKNNLGDDADPSDPLGEMMQFHVTKPLQKKDTSRLPTHLSYIPSLKENDISTVRQLKLIGSSDSYDRPMLLLNNQKWHDPITEKPKLNSTEIWSFINTTNFSHPMHLHLVQFQVLDIQPYDLERYNEDGTILFTGPPEAPPDNQRGWKDMIEVRAATITRVIAHFAPYTGDFVWHCHILEHEDYDMMRPFTVIEESEEKED
jgi:spore coat protein A